VKPRPRDTIPPPDLFHRYAALAFWRNLEGSKAYRIVTQSMGERQQQAMPEPAGTIVPAPVTDNAAAKETRGPAPTFATPLQHTPEQMSES
jgi:hypothetical protein